MSNIIALSGKKQAGKNCVANQILGIELTSLGIVRGQASINEQGQLVISDLFGDENYRGVLDVQRHNEAMIRFRSTNIDPYVKLYSFADCLKKNVCMDVLGLTYEQCYGTDEQKNTETHLKWENMPGIITPSDREYLDWDGKLLGDYNFKDLRLVLHEPGPMTARDVMQYVGAEIFRKMYGNVWVDATIRTIEADAPQIAIICDTRFPNEVEGVKKAGGKVLRLTRGPYAGQDQHDSETALDPDKFDWTKFDEVVDNADLTVLEQCQIIHPILEKWGLNYE